jgi:hypothetical protein
MFAHLGTSSGAPRADQVQVGSMIAAAHSGKTLTICGNGPDLNRGGE